MTVISAYSITGMILFSAGLYGVFFTPHILRRLMSLNIMAAGVFLLLIAIAHRNAAPHPDPVPHAMLLTGIVVAISATAFAVALARRYYELSGRTDLGEED